MSCTCCVQLTLKSFLHKVLGLIVELVVLIFLALCIMPQLMFLNAMYGGLGQSLGAIIGGKLQSKVGTVRTFLYAAATDLCFVVLVLSYISIRNDSKFRHPTPINSKS